MVIKHIRIILCAASIGIASLVSAETNLRESLERLGALRAGIAQEKIPLANDLMELEKEVIALRQETDRQQRLRDTGGINLTALEADLKARTEELDYMAGLLTEYMTSLETRADPSEWNLYRARMDAALRALDHPELSKEAQFLAAFDGLALGMERLRENLGGRIFEGRAVLESGDLRSGSFVLFGPVAYFYGSGASGIALRGDTEIPVVVSVANGDRTIPATITTGSGLLPLDPTLGRALALASTREGLVAHILKGGVWIYPILFAAFLSLLIAGYKFQEIGRLRPVPSPVVRSIVRHIRSGKKKQAMDLARAQGEPGSGLLVTAVQHANEPKELLEEILLEKIVETQPKMERLLPIIAVTAATAPLLGLLGTVTGMINTFKLITIFGTGDAKSLSGGISEALITTEFGLIVAIPSLILHAVLSRKAKGVMAGMESNAMTFVNSMSAKSAEDEDAPAA